MLYLWQEISGYERNSAIENTALLKRYAEMPVMIHEGLPDYLLSKQEKEA